LEPALWLIFAAIGIAMTFDFMGPLPNFKLGAAFWPQVILVGIMVVAIIHGAITYFYKLLGDIGEPELQSQELPNDEAPAVTAKLVAIFVVPLVYVLAMHKLGFFLVTPIFLPLYMYLMGVRKIRTLISVTAGLYSAIIFLFVVLVFTPLPQGAGYFHSLNGQFIGLFQ